MPQYTRFDLFPEYNKVLLHQSCTKFDLVFNCNFSSLSILYLESLLKIVLEGMSKMRQANMSSAPLPAIKRTFDQDFQDNCNRLGQFLKFISLLIKFDRHLAVDFMINWKEKLEIFIADITPLIVLCPETEELLAGFVLVATHLENLRAVGNRKKLQRGRKSS